MYLLEEVDLDLEVVGGDVERFELVRVGSPRPLRQHA